MAERLRARSPVVAVAIVLLSLGAGAAHAGPLDAPGAAKAIACAACHGEGGNSQTEATPVLAGMPTWYFKKAIEDYASGRRVSPEMEPFAKSVRLLGVDEIAGYFAAQRPVRRPLPLDAAAVARGRKAAAPCAACHGTDGTGDERRGIPSLVGQPLGYLKNQMLLFKADRRSPGDPALGQVKALMKGLDDAVLADLAAYYASLGR